MSDFRIPILADFVGFLADVMRALLQFCYEITDSLGFPNYGIAIIVLTVIIKTLLLPLAIKQIKSMKGMQDIQPKLQEIQEKYKNDRVKQGEAVRELYRKNNVNPAAGCLPLLIQMPFLIAIFYALQNFPYDPDHASFLWLENLGATDPTYVLPILAAATTFFISWQTMAKGTPTNQKTMNFIMPLFIGYIALDFPAGLVIYWIVGNIYQGIQQFFMYGLVKKEKEEEEAAAKKTKPAKTEKKQKKQEIKEEPAEAEAETGKKKKKVIRKKVIRKVAKKKAEAPAEIPAAEDKAAPAESAQPVTTENNEAAPAPETAVRNEPGEGEA